MATQTPPPEIIEDEELGFFRRFRIPLALGALLVIGGAVWVIKGDHKSAPQKAPIHMVAVLPPPPPPPPPPPTPPPTPPPPEPEQKPEFQPEEKPEEKPPDPPPAAPALGSNIVGDGDNGFGLVAGGGNGFGNGLGGNGGNRSKYGYYAGQVQGRVVEALRANKATRSAAMTLQVRIWVDATGRVTRASLAGSTGHAATDAALRDEILTGLQLPAPPPEGMPMPIVMRITAKRP
jgi:TonB family protein